MISQITVGVYWAEGFGEDSVDQIRVEPSLCQEPYHAGTKTRSVSCSASEALPHRCASADLVTGAGSEWGDDVSHKFLSKAFGQELLADCGPGVSPIGQTGGPKFGAGSIIEQSIPGTLSDKRLDETRRNAVLLEVRPKLGG